MATYNRPGVYIEEIQKLPPSIAPVATAIPAFIGYTEEAFDKMGNAIDPANPTPVRITSLLEYETYFGGPPVHPVSVDVEERAAGVSNPGLKIKFTDPTSDPQLPKAFLYYSVQLYYANGGGPCYILPIGNYPGDINEAIAMDTTHFTDAITILENYDEPTLYVFPDAALAGSDEDYQTIIDAAMNSCSKMQDRFIIGDIRNAKKTPNPGLLIDNFRGNSAIDKDLTKYCAVYFPYLKTNIELRTQDVNITIASHNVTILDNNGAEAPGTGVPSDATLDTLLPKQTNENTELYNAVKAFIRTHAKAIVPPSGMAAGVYARTDRTRGVWKAPANASALLVSGPDIEITNDLNETLNVDTTAGKSINAIRSFAGKGTLVWGARTLAGNDNEWRYVSVRRFFNFVEESVKKSTGPFVFEPNNANTWVKVRSMIENFLKLQWRDGALVGAKPEDAYFVHVGLNQTMTAEDILNGLMIIEIGMAVVRPAEFIILRFSHKMQES